MTKRIILNLGNIDSIFLLDESLLEPIVLKGTRWVLRRERRSNPPDLSDFSIENYQIGITKFKIHPIIFPKFNFNIDDITEKLSYPLEIYANNNETENLKEKINDLTNQTVKILGKWKDYKPIRGIIEDFFKVAKNTFGSDEFHSYTEKINGEKHLIRIIINNNSCTTGF